MASKTKVLLLCGGKSAEHEVSLRSARNVGSALDSSRYDVSLVIIDKKGTWRLNDLSKFLSADDSADLVETTTVAHHVHLESGTTHGTVDIWVRGDKSPRGSAEVVFPVLHGPNGEDGTMQGLLKLLNVPFVGPGVLGSAVGMDKDVMKRLLKEAGLPVGKFMVLHAHERRSFQPEQAIEKLALPIFVKPANMGSSVGISKAKDKASLLAAIDEALKYDRKVILEETIIGREIECAVLGNEEPKASIPGEIATGKQHEFYSYDAKYVDGTDQRIEIPANLPSDVANTIRSLAVQVFKVLCCEGLSRVDFFLTKENRILVNEINTLPGFTNISMYPMMWRATGLSDAQLMDEIVAAAKGRFEAEQRLL